LLEIGKKLRLAREELGLSLSDIQFKTKINLKFLLALESGQFHLIPSRYLKAYIKAYSQVVKVDFNDLFNLLEQKRKSQYTNSYKQLTSSYKGLDKISPATSVQVAASYDVTDESLASLPPRNSLLSQKRRRKNAKNGYTWFLVVSFTLLLISFAVFFIFRMSSAMRFIYKPKNINATSKAFSNNLNSSSKPVFSLLQTSREDADRYELANAKSLDLEIKSLEGKNAFEIRENEIANPFVKSYVDSNKNFKVRTAVLLAGDEGNGKRGEKDEGERKWKKRKLRKRLCRKV